ncbi:hypothetical protein EZV62_014485 [Acer yangbiense]|uniref:non-specific serine/threonine protein kinase n=1 Tax=Acer yangbiense TaxID=1000413 RepID=A0A5C7HUR7_9ROSI|nr:hypothetical protein EZV62_014485 [Acer yangbiense]
MAKKIKKLSEYSNFVNMNMVSVSYSQDSFNFLLDLCICEEHLGTCNLEFPASCSSAGKSQSSDVKEKNPMAQMGRTPSLKEFSFKDLKIATKNFSPDSLLGEGGFGRVYKGWVDEKTLAPSSKMGVGMAVAIKVLNLGTTLQGFQEWQSEVNFLGRHYHPNIISLFGCCWEDGKLVLVYEFMQRGSLENHLFRRDALKSLSWVIRLKIAIGAARGLNYNPKISDFALAKLGPSGDKTHVTTRMMGKDGYVAPEYLVKGHLYVKSDVYSFGVVLLELLTGLRAEDLRSTKDNLVKIKWFKPMLTQESQLKTIMDVRMEGQYSLEVAWHATQLTLNCLEVNHKFRPSMKEVLEVLVQIEAMTSLKEVPEVLEQIEAVNSKKEVPEVLEHITAVTSKKEVPEVLEHIEAIKEKSKNSNYSSRRSTAARYGQPRIHHRFLTSLKAPFQSVSSKLNCMRT